MRETILELARAICAPTEAEEPLLEALASAAEAELAGRLGTEVSPADCGDAFPCAAALLTAAGLLACRTGCEAEQFTVGDVSLRTGSGGAGGGAEILRRQAERLMAPYWQDDGFAFLEVRG